MNKAEAISKILHFAISNKQLAVIDSDELYDGKIIYHNHVRFVVDNVQIFVQLQDFRAELPFRIMRWVSYLELEYDTKLPLLMYFCKYAIYYFDDPNWALFDQGFNKTASFNYYIDGPPDFDSWNYAENIKMSAITNSHIANIKLR